MSEFAVEGPELKKMVKLARKGPIPFAFNPGKSDPEHHLAMHRKRPPGVLAKSAKKEGAGMKVAFGTCEVKQKVMELTCEKSVPAMAKKLKKFLKTNKVSLNVKILDESGNVLEEDIEDLPDDPDLYDEDQAPEAPVEQEQTAESPEVPDAAAIVARIKAAQPRIAEAPKAVADKLGTALKKVVAQIKEQSLQAADQSMSQIEAVLDKLAAAAGQGAQAEQTEEQDEGLSAADIAQEIRSLAQDAQGLPDALRAKVAKPIQQLGALLKAGDLDRAAEGVPKVRQAIETLLQKSAAQEAQPEPEEPASEAQAAPEPEQEDSARAEWLAAYEKLKPAADAALKEHRFASEAEEGTFKTRLNYAEANANEGAYEAALKTLPGLQAMLDDAANNAPGTSGPDIGEDVKPFAESRVKWASTRTTMLAELKKLQDAIAAACKEHEELAGVAGEVNSLTDYLIKLDERLEDKLDDIVNAPSGSERDGHKADARALLAEYQAELQTDFFKDVDANNGFVNVAVASTAAKALAEINSVLS